LAQHAIKCGLIGVAMFHYYQSGSCGSYDDSLKAGRISRPFLLLRNRDPAPPRINVINRWDAIRKHRPILTSKPEPFAESGMHEAEAVAKRKAAG